MARRGDASSDQMSPNKDAAMDGLTDQMELKSIKDKSKRHGVAAFKTPYFECRPSILTAEWNDAAVLVFNFFLATFILCAMAAVFRDTLVSKNPLQHFWLIWWNFYQLPETLLVWTAMFASTVICVFGGLHVWTQIPAKEISLKTQWPFLVAYVVYLLALFFYPLRYLYTAQLNCACSFVITCENTRLAMKVHSFVRENVWRCSQHKLELAYRGPDFKHQLSFPTLKQFLYHSFAPTFIYRDYYPMAPTRDWNVVGRYFVHCLGSIYVVNLIFISFVRPHFQQIDYKKSSTAELIYLLFPGILPGFMCLLVLFYGLLHCWQNMFAEALQFGDRHFYSNWWSSKNMAEYYRNWNLVVHEWLYAYIYRDIAVWTSTRTGQKVGQTLVFFLSAAFHEYWFGVSLRLFYPIMFNLYFVCGGIFFIVSRLISSPRVWNAMMWFNLLIGTGMFTACYASEWYARQQCPPYFENSLLDTFVPRLWIC